MRTFVAFDVNDAIRERIARFLEGIRGFAPQAHWVGPESIHVTLKFIGEKPGEVVETIKQALSTVRMPAPEIIFRGYGFFPTSKAPRVFWIGIGAGPHLTALAELIDKTLSAVGIPKEGHPFSPHLTLARGARGSVAPRWREGDQSPQFRHLQEKLQALPTPEFGSITAREFALYESHLEQSRARYTKIARFELE